MKFSEYKKELTEGNSSSIIFCFGRFQCPTVGHKVLIDEMQRLGKLNNYQTKVVVSESSHHPKLNPLSVNTRISALKEMFPGVPIDPIAKISLWDVLKEFSDTGIKNVVLVAGGDRAEKYLKEFSKYLNHSDPNKSLNFKSFQVANAGNRDPLAVGPGKVSATLAREAAKQGNISDFMEMMPLTFTKKSGIKLLNDIREGLNLSPIFAEDTSVMFFRRHSDPVVIAPEYKDPGIYSSFNLTPKSANNLYNWATQEGIPYVVLPTKFHCTLVWSETNAPDYKGGILKPITLDPDTMFFEVLNNALVIRFHNEILQRKWELAKELGAKPTFPSFKSHITISYNPADFDWSHLKIPDFPLVLEQETVIPLHEVISRIAGEKLINEKNL